MRSYERIEVCLTAFATQSHSPVIRSLADCSFVYNLNLFCLHAEDDEAEDASSSIPLDDGMSVDFLAIEVIQCLIEHHSAVFTDASETVWR